MTWSDIATIVTAVGIIVVPAIAGLWSYATKKAETKVAPYKEMAERLGKVEDKADAQDEQIEELRNDRNMDRAYIHQAVPWIYAHRAFALYQWPEPPIWHKINPFVLPVTEEDGKTTPDGHG